MENPQLGVPVIVNWLSDHPASWSYQLAWVIATHTHEPWKSGSDIRTRANTRTRDAGKQSTFACTEGSDQYSILLSLKPGQHELALCGHLSRHRLRKSIARTSDEMSCQGVSEGPVVASSKVIFQPGGVQSGYQLAWR